MLTNKKYSTNLLVSNGVGLDTSRNRIIVRDEEYELPAKAIQVMFHLMSHAQQTVSREELIQLVWSGNEYVGEKALTHSVWQLRKVLNESTDSPTFIETIPKLGYRFLLKVGENHEDGNAYDDKSQSSEQNEKSDNHIFFKVLIFVLIVASLLVVFYLQNQSSKETELASSSIKSNLYLSNIKMLTSLNGVERAPDISADGKRMVFEWTQKGSSSDIYTLDLTNEHSIPIPLIKTPASERSPVWSLDASRVAFVRRVGKLNCTVLIYSLITETEQRIDDCAGINAVNVAWSPDGEYLAYSYYQSQEMMGGIVLYHLASRQNHILSKRKSSRNDVDNNPCWSNDSQKVAFSRVSNSGTFEVVTINLDHEFKKSYTLEDNTLGDILVSCTFSPENNIVFPVRENGNAIMKSIQLDTSEVTDIVSSNKNLTNVDRAKFVNNSEAIVFSTFKVDTNLSQVNISNTINEASINDVPRHPAEFLIQSIGEDYDGRYSPDGSQIIFVSTRDGETGIWLSRADGTHIRKIIKDFQWVGFPVWSPDGHKFAFSGINDSNQILQLFVYDFLSDQVTQLSHTEGKHITPSWSIDGQSILVGVGGENTWNIWRYFLDDSSRQQVTKDSGLVAKELSNTNKIVLILPNVNGLWLYSPEEDKYELIIDNYSGYNWLSWDYYNDKIYYFENELGITILKQYSFSDQTVKTLAEITNATKPASGSISVLNEHKFLISNMIVNDADIGIAQLKQNR